MGAFLLSGEAGNREIDRGYSRDKKNVIFVRHHRRHRHFRGGGASGYAQVARLLRTASLRARSAASPSSVLHSAALVIGMLFETHHWQRLVDHRRFTVVFFGVISVRSTWVPVTRSATQLCYPYGPLPKNQFSGQQDGAGGPSIATSRADRSSHEH